MLKRTAVMLCAACLALSLTACSGAAGESASTPGKEESAAAKPEAAAPKPEAIKTSPDKYTWYVKNYVGMNAASIGYTSIAGDRRDTYGAANLKVIFVSADGTYLDPENEDQLKEYTVTGQNLAPNTEIKLTFQVDSEGVEYSNLVDVASFDDIVLAVKKVGQAAGDVNLQPINPSPDKYTRYVKDYVGMNTASFGYVSLAGDLRDYYGHGNIKLNLLADDGTFIDVEDNTMLSQYVVTSQDIAPNTEISMTFAKDPEGVEYSNLVETQSVESISLGVTKVQ